MLFGVHMMVSFSSHLERKEINKPWRVFAALDQDERA
jgi:hypothetical protein